MWLVHTVQESLADEKFKNILYRIEEFKRQLDRVGWCVGACVGCVSGRL